MKTATARSFRVLLIFAWCALLPVAAYAQAQSTLRVTVRDETEAALIHATVTLVDSTGVPRQVLVDESGVATFTGLLAATYQITVEAEGFQGFTGPVTVRRGNNTAIATLTVAFREQIEVTEIDAAARRDNGFSTTLSREAIDALSDDPDEMADQLRQMAGPGAQLFIDGFRGGRLPPKDQIQQIRFNTNSYSAEYHEAGMVRIEVITKPGMGNWRGTMNFGFRDDSLNATNKFATSRGPEQQKRFMFNMQGPVWKGKTGISIAADGNLSYDAQTIVARTPTGEVNDQVRRPVEGVNATVRLEQLLGATSQIRAEYSRRENTRSNLGVGDFDLLDRAYSVDTVTDSLRVRNTRTIGKSVFSELRFEVTQSSNTSASASSAPTIRVLDQFTSGGAGQMGTREGRQFTVAQNFDFSIARHMLRAGVLVDGAWWDSTQQSNANGTFTFSSMEDYLAGRPRTYSRRVGDPLVAYSQFEAGWYIQDDFRVSKNLSASVGLRQEVQTNMDDTLNLAPRAAFTYALRKGNIRGGYGVFYDWLESSLYEQVVRVDGSQQVDEVIINPSFPDVGVGAGTTLPASRIQLGPQLTQPMIQQASIGYERPFGQFANFRTDYMWTRGRDTLRSVNVNAPLDGVRPDPDAGNVTQIETTGRRASDRITVAMTLRQPRVRGLMGNVMYQYANNRNFADSPLALPSNSNDPDADWGPSAMDLRHRLFFMLNAPLPRSVRLGMQAQYSSAPPYTVTTGNDDNGDTVFNDRPAGVGRNSLRGASQFNVNLRVNRSFNLGGVLGGDGPMMLGGGAPPPPPPNNQQGPGGGAGAGGSGPVQMVMMDGNASKYRLDVYLQVFNLLNTANYNAFIGNQQSTFFGQPTSAAPPRRLEIGASLTF
ncbi:MAG TPA: carboxypeptidase-like regulatory domain-containing protein [Vicinamibacterales bacterium]|nr:carboxypeptidase-like regulatory domain-containing protein [Vicinamibacterales bacterium]